MQPSLPQGTRTTMTDTLTVQGSFTFHSAWWYRGCHHPNLNGLYREPGTISGSGMNWNALRPSYPLKFTEGKAECLKMLTCINLSYCTSDHKTCNIRPLMKAIVRTMLNTIPTRREGTKQVVGALTYSTPQSS